ncbi:MAG: Fe-S cluster assembly ATPase SufC [Candidatus Altiarchaeales archaeon IMC4]|nr:MAG: Fe-S cluster assembly ATPase SufC [Candidatus Altiarchaeales archaeon IMC4]
MLSISNLKVSVSGKEILHGVNLEIPEGETWTMFGPNGSGKTTLMMAISGMPGYSVTSGGITFLGKDITKLAMDGRAKLGIGTGFQQPPEITGVKLRDMIRICSGKGPKEDLSKDERKLVEKLRLSEFLDRDINAGFSGGEKKRAEILQLLFMKPKLLLLDEPDSGVDIESLRLIAGEVQNYIEKSGASALIITHQGEVLDYLKSEKGCVMVDGRIHCIKNPKQVLDEIRTVGYQKCIACHKMA